MKVSWKVHNEKISREKNIQNTKTLVQYLRILRKYDKNQVKQIPTNKYTVCVYHQWNFGR